MNSLSPVQKKIYEYIKKTVAEKGYSPSVREIKNELMIKSTSTVQLHLKRLEDAGYIYKEDGKSRTLRVDVESGSLMNKIPILGDIREGSSLNVEENFDGYVDFIPPKGHSREDLFAVRIKSSPSADIGILKGDYVICDKKVKPSVGDVAVIIQNREVSAIIYDDSNKDIILGKAIASLRFWI